MIHSWWVMHVGIAWSACLNQIFVGWMVGTNFKVTTVADFYASWGSKAGTNRNWSSWQNSNNSHLEFNVQDLLCKPNVWTLTRNYSCDCWWALFRDFHMLVSLLECFLVGRVKCLTNDTHFFTKAQFSTSWVKCWKK